MVFSPWLDELVFQVVNHLRATHRDDWTYSRMIRGAYFFRYQMRNQYPVRDDLTAFHLFINNFANEETLHCAAKLEGNQIANIPQPITALFHPNRARIGHSGGGLEIGIVRIRLPQEFDVEGTQQHLPPDLWNEILIKFLLNPQIINFINACAP